MWDCLSKLKDNAEDAVYSVQFKVKDAYDNTKRAVARAVKGYDSTAVWDCGPQLMVEIPKKLNRTQREALKAFEDSLKDDNYEKRKGFFKNLRDRFSS